MDIKTNTNFKIQFTNFFGGFGYFFCSLQWFWAVILYFSFLKEVGLTISTSSDSQIVKPAVVVDSGPNVLAIIIMVVITIIMTALTIYIIIKIPSIIVKTSKKFVHQTAENVTPLVLQIQHKKDTNRIHIKLSAQLIIVMKVLLIIIPLIMSYLSQFIDNTFFDFNISMYVSLWLACFCLVFFVFQYALAGLLAIKRQDLW